jgi:drug/metabolite transporter (DMT)-like permease
VPLAFGVLAALAAAVLYSIGVTLQSVEAREAPVEESLKPSLIKRLVTRPRWVGGTSCVVGGWAMQAAALMLAPITIVQPALAVSVVVLLFIGARFFAEAVRRREVVAALAVVAGVGGLVLASPGHSDTHAEPLRLMLGMGTLGTVALAPYALRGDRGFGGAVVVFSAGLAYAWTGFSTKFLADGMSSGAWVAAALWLGATAAAAAVGLLSEMTALQSRSAIRVFPVVLVVQIVVAVLLAPLLAGERWSPEPLRVAGLAVSLAVLAAGTRALAGARAVGRAIATEEGEGALAPSARQARDGDEGREGDGADHQQRQHEANAQRHLAGNREGRDDRGDEPCRRDRQPGEVLAVVGDREAG